MMTLKNCIPLQYVGVRPSDLSQLPLPSEVFLPITQKDRTRANNMIVRGGLPQEIIFEIETILNMSYKAEIEVLSVFNKSCDAIEACDVDDYLTEVYLPSRMQDLLATPQRLCHS